MVDVVDATDRVVGSVPRPRLKEGSWNYRVVHVLALDPQGRVLVQRVATSRGAAFSFGSSVAGHVRAGESYEAAAAREFREELGVDAPELAPLGVAWLDEGDRRKFIGVFLCRVRGALKPDPAEVAAIERFTVGEVRQRLRDQPSLFSETFARVFRHADAADAWD